MLGPWLTTGLLLTLSLLVDTAVLPDDDDIKEAGPDNSCDEKCPKATRLMMKMYSQCSMRAAQHIVPNNTMPNEEFLQKLAEAPDSCLVDDVCYDYQLAMESGTRCLRREGIQQGFDKHTTSRRRKRDVDFRVRLEPSLRVWPLPIPYAIGASFSAGEEELIDNVIRHFQINTCVTFTKGTFTTSFVGLVFSSASSGCFSNLGRLGVNQQIVNIGSGCESFAIIAHEIGHALGLIHEQSRADRDQFVNIFLDNIRDIALSFNFDIDDDSYVSSQYDYGSVMHYRRNAFANPTTAITVDPIDPRFSNYIGQRREVSFLDYFVVNRLYCREVCTGNTLNCQNGGYPDPTDCNRCRCPVPFNGTDPECTSITPFDGTVCGTDQLRILSLTVPSTTISLTNIGPGPFVCVWRVTAPMGQSIIVDALSFSTSSNSGNCHFQWLQIFNGLQLDLIQPRYCAVTGPSDVIIDSNDVFITFTSYSGINVPGFSLNVYIDVNECLTETCGANAGCQNTIGSFMCVCNDGFTGDGASCSDINECIGDPCNANEACMNGLGSFTCVCAVGFCGNVGECVECTNIEFHNNIHEVINNLRGGVGASNMVKLEFDEPTRAEIESLNSGCDGTSGPTGTRWFSRNRRVNNPAATLADFGNLTTFLTDILAATSYDPASNACSGSASDCFAFRRMLYKHFLRVGCAAVLCDSSTILYSNIYGSTPGTLVLVLCSFRPFLDPNRPIYTLGEACTSCPLGLEECRQGLCVADAGQTSTVTPTTTTELPTSTSELAPTTTPPAPTTTEPVPTTTPPAPTTTEPVPTTTLPAPTTTEPVPTTTPPAPTTSEPVPTTTPPAPTTTEPVPTTTPPAPTTTEPLPTTTTTAPTTTEPVPTTTPPAPTTTEPVPTTTPPVPTTTEPVPTTTPPAPTTTEPVPTTTPPALTTTEPVPTTTPPALTTTEPVPTTTPPVPTTTEPVPTTTPPAPTTTEPVPTTTPPAPTTTEPVPTTTPPAPTTTEPVPTTTPPAPTTTEPVPTATPPAPTTTEPVPPVPTTPEEVPSTQPPATTTPEEPTTMTPTMTVSPGQNTFLFLQAVNTDPDFASAVSGVIMLLTDAINEFCATNASVCCQNTSAENDPDAIFVTEDDIEISILSQNSSTATYSITASGNENNTLCQEGSGPIPIPADLLVYLLNSNVEVINAALQDCCNATVTLVSPTLPPPPPPSPPSPPSTGLSLGLILGLSIGGATIALLAGIGLLVGCMSRQSPQTAVNAVFAQQVQRQQLGQRVVQRPIQFQARRQVLTMRRNPMINSSPASQTFTWVS